MQIQHFICLQKADVYTASLLELFLFFSLISLSQYFFLEFFLNSLSDFYTLNPKILNYPRVHSFPEGTSSCKAIALGCRTRCLGWWTCTSWRRCWRRAGWRLVCPVHPRGEQRRTLLTSHPVLLFGHPGDSAPPSHTLLYLSVLPINPGCVWYLIMVTA